MSLVWMRRNWRQILICGLLLLVAGCVKKSESNGASVYSYEWWVPTLAAVGGIVAAGLGWNLRQTDWRGWILVVAGILGAVFGTPSLALNRTVVDAKHFEARHGVWPAQSVQTVAFDNLTSMNLKEKVSFRKGRKRVSYDLESRMKDGSTVTTPLGETMKEAALEIILHAKLRNIPVTGLGEE